MANNITLHGTAVQTTFKRLTSTVTNNPLVRRILMAHEGNAQALEEAFDRMGLNPVVLDYVQDKMGSRLIPADMWGCIQPSRWVNVVVTVAEHYPPLADHLQLQLLAGSLFREAAAYRLFGSPESLRDTMYKAKKRMPEEVKTAILDAIWQTK